MASRGRQLQLPAGWVDQAQPMWRDGGMAETREQDEALTVLVPHARPLGGNMDRGDSGVIRVCEQADMPWNGGRTQT